MIERRDERDKAELVKVGTIVSAIYNTAGKSFKKVISPADVFPLLKKKPVEEDAETAALRASGKTHIRLPIDDYLELKKRV